MLLALFASAYRPAEAQQGGSTAESSLLASCGPWMANYTNEDLHRVVLFNCGANSSDLQGRVPLAVKEWQNAMARQRFPPAQVDDWKRRIDNASAACEAARAFQTSADFRRAAETALVAFGVDIMSNTLCCARLRPPLCTMPSKGTSALSVTTPAGYLMVILILLMVAMCIGVGIESCVKRRKAEWKAEYDSADDDDAAGMMEAGAAGSGLAHELSEAAILQMAVQLQEEWLRRNCLGAMPRAHRLAGATSHLFAKLQAAFDFQWDSVRNQYEHFLSLLRAHVSIVADRVTEGKVDEEYLLLDALDNLHGELLEGFRKWRETFRACEATKMVATVGVPRPAGIVLDPPIPNDICRKNSEAEAMARSTQLVEIAVYLLVWGEAGNVRFMPEVVYFITELALAAEGPGGSAFYGTPVLGTGTGRFLARIIRPLYNLVFEEWYKKVDINEKGGDRKEMHKGFDRYLLPDVANYDDWNEFFCDPQQVAENLILTDGNVVFERPHSQRFASLYQVQWATSLRGAQIKTHRECHSLLGLFATTHRVWLMHFLLFVIGVCLVASDPPAGPSGLTAWQSQPLLGVTLPVRLAAVGLVVPAHAALWALARLETTSSNVLQKVCGFCFCLGSLFWTALFVAPIFTYAALRILELPTGLEGATQREFASFKLVLVVHYVVSAVGVYFLLFDPAKSMDKQFELTKVPCRLRLVRYLFWLVVLVLKFLLGLVIFNSVYEATKNLQLIRIGQAYPGEILGLWRTSSWGAGFFEWLLLWGTVFYMFCADTAMWFQLGCMVLGVCTVFVQRRCRICQFMVEDAIAKIPQRFSEHILYYAPKIRGEVSEYFPALWDRIVAYMRCEDKCQTDAVADLSYSKDSSSRSSSDRDRLMHLSAPLQPVKSLPREPDLFTGRTPCDLFLRDYCTGWKSNLQKAEDLKWRLLALSRGLGLKIPRPYRVPYIPGITVLIPHYGETIIMSKSELFDMGGSGQTRRQETRCGGCRVPVRETVPLIDWLKARYDDEFGAFINRMQAGGDWPVGSSWDAYNEQQWDEIRLWASMRMQTLWRTVAGMTLYHPALQCHYEIQRDPHSSLTKDWKPSDSFTCLVSMQMYKTFDKDRLQQTNKMFRTFPDSLKIAFIDYEDLDRSAPELAAAAARDGVHRAQARRYYSCLIDNACEELANLRRKPRFRVELPGYPILGDGKSDNQNHAIPFMRGIFCQCIDANQGAYFEQMMMLPCVLGEFRTLRKGGTQAKRIIGLPEHITSDFGSIGDFAAGSEIAFGTISQRSFAVLGGRMHYGHPDIMNKQYMMQQGGVSKATKTINLSEDIFAGMDFTLRGDGRKIYHREYFHLAKGRDLGFNAVLGFFSKLSNGTGEQLLSRQTLRLMQVLPLPECLTFYYAHAGYYITQYFISTSMPLLVFTWLLVLCADCQRDFQAFSDMPCTTPAAWAFSVMLGTFYSVFMLFFLVATSLPLFAEIWMERSFGAATVRWLLQQITCSFLLFIFQAKIIGFYIMAEIRQGGASYVATGRGLPTERREFVGAPSYLTFRLLLFFENMDVSRLSAAPEALRAGVADAIREAVAAAAGDKRVTADHVQVELVDLQARSGVKVLLEPPKAEGILTIPIKGKLTATSVGPSVAAKVAAVPGVAAMCTDPRTGFRRELHIRAVLEKAVTDWRYEKKGGLYLDYTKHTFYEGFDLLLFTLMVLYAGAWSEARDPDPEAKDNRGILLGFTFVSIGLVIFSWLYAPFIFNPYQFSVGYLKDDVKAWYGFFFVDGGKMWEDWYVTSQLKPKRGLAKSIIDFEFFFTFFAVTAWISQMSIKQDTNRAIYSMDHFVQYMVIFTLLPPFCLSSLYCFIVPIIEGCIGCVREGQSPAAGERARGVYVRAPGGAAAPGGPLPAPPPGHAPDVRHTAEDQFVSAAPVEGCHRIPLAVSAVVVTVLQLGELLIPLMLTIHRPNQKLFISGIMLKFIFWKIILGLGEAGLSMKGLCKRVDNVSPCFHSAVKLLVYSNNMMRDIVISGFIFITMSPLVLLTALNDIACPGVSLHHFLVYRTPGPLVRAKAYDDSDSEEEGSSDGSSFSPTYGGGPPGGSGPPPTHTMGAPPGGSFTMLRPVGAPGGYTRR